MEDGYDLACSSIYLLCIILLLDRVNSTSEGKKEIAEKCVYRISQKKFLKLYTK